MSEVDRMSVAERWMSRYECVDCGAEVSDERGHVHVKPDDACTASPVRQVYYVPEDEYRGAVGERDELRAMLVRLLDVALVDGYGETVRDEAEGLLTRLEGQ